MSARRRHPLSDAEMAAALVDPRNVARWEKRLSSCTFVAPTGCLVFGEYEDAYSQFRVLVGHRVLLVGQHRYALMLKLARPLHPQMMALHSCDHGACISELHLREGTQLDNMRDAARKGRLGHGWDTRADLFVDLSPSAVAIRLQMRRAFHAEVA